MILAMLAMAQAVVPAPFPPTDWSKLGELRVLKPWQSPPELSRFVQDEVAAGRCDAAVRSADGGYTLTEQLVVRVDTRGSILEVVPRAIGCPTVEQYASGLLSRLARGNVAPNEGWFRATITFSWTP